MLGRRQLQRRLQLLAFASGRQNATGNPLLLMAATRGRLVELLAECLRPDDPAFIDQAFMVGIMSLMPALVGLPIAHIVTPLGFAKNVRDARCTGEGVLGQLLALAESSESADLTQLAANLSAQPVLRPKALSNAQPSALQWANGIARADRLNTLLQNGDTAPEDRQMPLL